MEKLKGVQQLKKELTRIASIPDSEWELYEQHLSEKTFEKSTFLVRAGDVVKNFYFITSGLVRFFYTTEDGKEFNKHFAMENDFAGSFYSFLNHSPCEFTIQALEFTQAIVLPDLSTSKAFHDRHPCWELLGRKNAEGVLFIKEAREKELLLDSLEVRYQRFVKKYPRLSQRVPQYHIASYLGVTDVALSRLRKKISDKT